MVEAQKPDLAGLAELTSEIVSAYVGGNAIDYAALPDLIASVHDSLVTITLQAGGPDSDRPTPPMSRKRSSAPNYPIDPALGTASSTGPSNGT